MSRWFRFYEGALDDPKVQRLSPPVYKGWVNLLCLASKHKGKLPSLPDIAFALRISDHEADSLIQALTAAGLLDDVGGSMQPHKWYERQYEDTTNKERQRKFRERKKAENDVTRYASVTTVTDNGPVTSVEQNRTEEKRKKDKGSPTAELELVVSKETASAIVEHRQRMKAPLTERAAKALANKLKAWPDPEEAAAAMLSRGWRGFEPDWMPKQPERKASVFPMPAWKPGRLA